MKTIEQAKADWKTARFELGAWISELLTFCSKMAPAAVPGFDRPELGAIFSPPELAVTCSEKAPASAGALQFVRQQSQPTLSSSSNSPAP